MISGHLYRPGSGVLKGKAKTGPKQAYLPTKPSKSTPRREQASDKKGAQRSATSPPSDKPQGYTEGSGGGAPGGRPRGKDLQVVMEMMVMMIIMKMMMMMMKMILIVFEELLKEEEKYLDKDQTKLKLGPDQTTVMISKKMYIVQPATVEQKLGPPGGGTMPTHGWNGKCRRKRRWSTIPS